MNPLKFWVPISIALHPQWWPGLIANSVRQWCIRQSDVYPPRWWWPIVRIYGGPDGQQSRTCYMTRIILSLFHKSTWYQVYLHIFHREDMDRDPHDHPFGFWTFPLWQGYYEDVFEHDENGVGCFKTVFVRRWRWHYRPATHTHRVVATETGAWPLWTLVIRESKKRDWGFWCHDARQPNQPHQSKRHHVPFPAYVYGGVDANNSGIDDVCPGAIRDKH